MSDPVPGHDAPNAHDADAHDPPHAHDTVYGTTARDAPASRADLERAVRGLNLSDLDLRDALLQLAARVVALTDELTRRLDGVEPVPAAPGTPAAPPRATVEAAVDEATQATLATIRANDTRQAARVALDVVPDKYEVVSPPVPCAELIPLCHARCCAMTFPLSTQDLDEGVIRWDYGQPYLIRQRASDGYCVHHDPDSRGCTVHAFRPRVCRAYDCRSDRRVWIDYERRIATPLEGHLFAGMASAAPPDIFDLVERAKARGGAIAREALAISHTFADAAPHEGPRPEPPAPRLTPAVAADPGERKP